MGQFPDVGICSKVSLPAIPEARMSALALSRIRGQKRQNRKAPARQAAPPSATVKGAPNLLANAPAKSAPNGAIPAIIIV